MRRASLLLAVLALGLGALALAPAQANTIATQSDPSEDTIDPVRSQNALTRTEQDIPVADILSWSAQFNGLTDKIVFKVKIRAKMPRAGETSPTPSIEAPPGFVGASYRLMFTSSTAQVSQTTGKNCAAFSDGHANAVGHQYTSHQNVNFAQCTDTREGPYKAPNFKHFIDYGVREELNDSGQFENQGTVAWGIFDTYNQSLTFHDVETEMPCTTAPGFVLGGGACPWSVQIVDTDPSPTVNRDELTLTFPYNPTWVLSDDLDDNAVFNDENRGYVLVNDIASLSGVIATAWVDQVVGLPFPICDPTDPGCTGDEGDPLGCELVPPDTACISSEANQALGETQSYVNNFQDCTPPNNGNARASCLQEIGGFVYVVDWGPDNAYDLGLFSWPVPGYIASPSCRYQAAIPFITSGRMPDGVAIYSDNQRNSGYTGLILPYGVRLHSDEDYPESPDNNPYDNPNAPRPQHVNIWTAGAPVPSQTIDNPLPNVFVANPLLNDATCTYSSSVGSKFVDANGKTATGAGA